MVDYGQGIQELAELLVGLGHTRLAFLAGPARSASNELRLQGLEKFTAAHPDIDLRMLDAGSNFEAGHQSADAVLASGATGVMAFNDLVAMGLLSGLHERGVRVPEDISVTGFDDIPFARYTTPTLSTAAVPINDLGQQAWHRMRDLIRNVPPDAGAEGPTIFLPRLEVRGSTGPAKA
jgi:LacI family transcriptional regulator